jgi:hypothetical protein
MTSHETVPTSQPVDRFAAPPAPRRTWSRGKTIGAVVVAVAVAATAGITVAVVDKTSGTASSAGSITVASTDGYTRTYLLNGNDQASGVATGHTVSLTATVSGETTTVTRITDENLAGGTTN